MLPEWPALPSLPRLGDADRRRMLAVGAAAAAAGTVGLTVALVARRCRRGASAASDEEVLVAVPQPLACSEAIATLEQLRELEGRSAAVRVLFAPPVLSVCVVQQGEALAAIPAAICKLRELRELDLRGNAIEALPPTIARLSSLTRLNLSGNRLSSLPEQLGSLAALVDLDVGGNQLAALPASVGALASLRFLNAMNNQLIALPDTIGGLTALHRCGLKGNRLTELPPSIGQLSSLVELYLTDNLLEELPPEMGNLQRLVKLQASFNRLRSLPEQLGRLPHLEMLRVASCRIGEVPAALRHAPRLAWMSLASNPVCRALSPRKPPVLELTDLEMGPKLGDGASGEVFLASWRGRRVAVKVFVADRSPDGHSRDEMAIACSVSERHLVRVVAQLSKPLGLVMEFAEGQPIAEKPNLESLLRCRWAPGLAFPLGWLLKVALGVAAALEHMHYRGIAHGDVYAHNVMADEAGQATLCDYGASFPYRKGGPVPYEAHEVRAFGLMLADMVQRLDIGFEGMEQVLEAQRELLALIQLCVGGPPVKRPTFGAVGRRLRAIQKTAARAGLATETPRGSDAGMFTPRTCVTEMPTPRSPYRL